MATSSTSASPRATGRAIQAVAGKGGKALRSLFPTKTQDLDSLSYLIVYNPEAKDPTNVHNWQYLDADRHFDQITWLAKDKQMTDDQRLIKLKLRSNTFELAPVIQTFCRVETGE